MKNINVKAAKMRNNKQKRVERLNELKSRFLEKVNIFEFHNLYGNTKNLE